MTAYEIQVQGHLDPRWESLLNGFTIAHALTAAGQPVSVLRGEVLDPAALYGLLSRLRDLGAVLVSVQVENA